MTIRRLAGAAAAFLLTCALSSQSTQLGAQNLLSRRYADLPANATRCDPSLPIFVELNPLSEPAAGLPARFEARVESTLDPDLVESSWMEYALPERVQTRAGFIGRQEIRSRAGRGRQEFELIFPEEDRYEIRARFVVKLTSGKTISQTAVRWVELGAKRPPKGMIGRIVDPDGDGISVYRGSTGRN